MTLKGSREAWRFRVNGNFLGTFLERAGDTLVLSFQDEEHWTNLAAVSAAGRGLWEKRWEDLAYFRCSKDRLFVDGDRARRIDPETGEVLSERDLGSPVDVRWAVEAGPVYRIPEERKYFGLDGESLAILWEWRVDKEDFTFDEGRLCRYRPNEGITIYELPSLKTQHVVAVAPVGAAGAHAHLGDLFCHFGYTEGGRAAVDLKTGEVAWKHSDPAGYGLISFDGESGYSSLDGVSAYDLRTGKQLWKRTFGEIPTSRARVESGRVYVATGDRFVHVLDAATGETLVSHQLKFKISGTVEPSPVVALGDNRIVVGTRKEIICLETG